jgi:hypothetical protein
MGWRSDAAWDADETAPSGAPVVRVLDGCGEFDEFLLGQRRLDACTGMRSSQRMCAWRRLPSSCNSGGFGLGWGGWVGGAAAEIGMLGEHAGDSVVGGRVVTYKGRGRTSS